MRKFTVFAAIMGLSLALTACAGLPEKVTEGEKELNSVSDEAAGTAAETEKEEPKEDKAQTASADTADTGAAAEANADDSASDNMAEEIETADGRILTCRQFDFSSACRYIEDMQGEVPSVDYEAKDYPTGVREGVVDNNIMNETDRRLPELEKKTVRLLRSDKNGATVDVTVYTDKDSRRIEKLAACEYGSDARTNTEYYFKEGQLSYVYEYLTEFYGNTYVDANMPSKKAFFANDALLELYVNDHDSGYKNTSYAAKNYDDFASDTKTAYINIERRLLNSAYALYEAVRDVPATALIYGYVGDEYGGILSNVHMTFYSKANHFEKQIDTNGDGYFEIRVPANEADWYGVGCKYGTFADVSVDDINITVDTLEYSLGTIYMSEPGKNLHETNTYLLNVLKKSPVALGNDEYLVEFTYDTAGGADLKSCLMNLKTGKQESGANIKFKAAKGEQYRFYVLDNRGGHSGNPMTYEMSSSDAIVKVYSASGLVASYQVPVGRAGTVWEVFSVRDGEISAVGNYFHDGRLKPFFEN